MGPDSIEQRNEVVGVRNEIGEDDHVECLVEVELFTRGVNESKLRISTGRDVNHRPAEIDTDAARRPQ